VPKYTVEVQNRLITYCVLDVEVNNEEEAQERALELASTAPQDWDTDSSALQANIIMKEES
jgi:hypothetical protein